MTGRTYRFGSFELQEAQRRLLHSGKPVTIARRAFDLLLVLVKDADRLVSKEELLRRVWTRLVVEESNLAVQVSSLRKIVGAHSIEAVAGHGYRFTLHVTVDDAEPVTRRDNLPRQLTSLIGREREVSLCQEFLRRTRLLTVTGPGGLGKTRLSLAVAESELTGYADGVWLVELAPLREPTLVVHAIASVLGVREPSGRSIIDALAEFLHVRRLLLVLDNCEHVLHACARSARQILQSAPDVKIVASSREPLHLTGETIYEPPSLSFPDPGDFGSVEDIVRHDAVCLFAERAGAVQAGFSVNETNARAVAQICCQLDGIPLAIELAAARVRVMSVEWIARQLKERFSLLRYGDRAAQPRQQTLHATIQWSHDLLADDERTLMRRLAAFFGGWTLDAAEAVCAGGGLAAPDVFDVHRRLADKSLVAADPQVDRYRMLETIRLFAREQLCAAGEVDATSARHLAHFVALAKASEDYPGDEEDRWAIRFNAERENFRVAFEWAKNHDPVNAIHLVGPVAGWLVANYFDLGSPVLASVLARPEIQDSAAMCCRGLSLAGVISYYRGRDEDARRYLEDAAAIAESVDERAILADARTHLGLACLRLGDRNGARHWMKEGLALARSIGHLPRQWTGLNSLGELLATDGAFIESDALYEEALAIARRSRHRHLAVVSLLNLARNALSTRSAERAKKWLREAMVTLEEMEDRRNLYALLLFAAGLASLRGDWGEAALLYGASRRQMEAMGLRLEPADEASLCPLVDRVKGELGAAAFAEREKAGRLVDEAGSLLEVRRWIHGLG